MEEFQNILEGCKRNERKSQERLYYQFYPAMFTLCKKFFQDEHDIQTALNNGMMRVFKNIGQFDASRGSLFNWIYTIIRNSCLTIIRDRKVDAVVEYREEVPDTAKQNPFDGTDWSEIFGYLSKLPPATRVVCSLYYLEGFSIKEICDDTSMKEGTVKWHLNESRNRLKDIWAKNNKI